MVKIAAEAWAIIAISSGIREGVNIFFSGKGD
jgi:hypothetical protein